MYQIQNIECFYLWDGQKLITLGSKENLIAKLAHGFYQDENKICNTYFQGLAFTPQDIKHFKHYQFFDNDFRCIDPRIYYNEALAYYNKYLSKFIFGDWGLYKEQEKNNIRFRIDPVPNTGVDFKRRLSSSHHYVRRKSKISYLYKQFKNPEYKGFNRGSVKGLHIIWYEDLKPRSISKSRCWKDQRKTRHQWEK